MQQLAKAVKSRYEKVLVNGPPKDAGKSTFAMTAPQPVYLYQFDLGGATLPPGVDPQGVYVKSYPPAAVELITKSDRWRRPSNVCSEIMDDINKLHAVFAEGTPLVGDDGEPLPLPKTIVLDGMVEMSDHVLDWILHVNGLTGPEDADNPLTIWGKRLQILRTLYNIIIPLPVNVILITWEEPEMTVIKDSRGKLQRVATGKVIPNLGGAMDIRGPGKVDSSLYAYSEMVSGRRRWFVRTQPNEKTIGIGMRNGYKVPEVIDVTVQATQSSNYVSPWDRVFSHA